MDRRQRKTREAIFNAFTALLSKKDFHRITVGEIIEHADVGRATFYAHFETKDELLDALCDELFCHIFDAEQPGNSSHRHIFDGDCSASAFLHLFEHLSRNDHNLIRLLSSQNNALFMHSFNAHLEDLVRRHLPLFADRRRDGVPEAFWIHHVTATLSSTLRWWLENGRAERPETITSYFFRVL